MFQILVVDDEYPIREWLVHIIHAGHPDFYVESAKNGLEALEKLQTSSFDLIITDIRMPHMDGLELLKEIHTQNIQTGAIVLSSYDDYSYVRNAFKNDAVDYMLKAEIDSDKLLDAIENFRTKNPPAPNINKLCKKINSALSANIYGNADFCSMLSSFGDFVPQNSYYCFLLKIYSEENAEDFTPFLPFVDDTKLKFCLAVTERLYLGCVEIHHSSLLFQMQRQALYNKQLQKYNSFSLFLYSDIHADKTYLLDTLQLLYTCRDLDFYNISIHRPETYPTTQELQLKEHYLHILNSIRKREYDLTCTQLDNFFDYAIQTFYPDIVNLKNMCQNFCEAAYSNTHTIDMNAYHQYTQEIAVLLQTAINCTQLQQFLTNALEQLYRHTNAHTHYSQRIAQAVSIIEKNYMDEITLANVAQSLYISPEYLSRSFKKEVGSNFNTYLNNIRLQHALDLLKEPASRISEVAEKTGFQTPAYFSKCFKTAFGISPQEWKSQNINNG